MPFLKLDCGILDSSLWIDKPARDIFLTALLMAVPEEYLEPIDQLEVRTMKSSGWSAPPGWYGFVAAAGSGIIRRAMVEDEAGHDALERLGSPDKQSRSDQHEGRRLIRIAGGYLVLNFIAYRDRDYSGAVRQKRWRERQKTKGNGTVTPLLNARNAVTVTHSREQSTEAEAEAEAEAEGKRERPHSKRGVFAEIPSWEEWWTYCRTGRGPGAEWYARDKYDAADQINWSKQHNWKAYAHRCRAWWEQDGSPMEPAKKKSKNKDNPHNL